MSQIFHRSKTPINNAYITEVKVSSIYPNDVFQVKTQIPMEENGETRLCYVSGIVLGLEVDLNSQEAVLFLNTGRKIHGRIDVRQIENREFEDHEQYFVFG